MNAPVRTDVLAIEAAELEAWRDLYRATPDIVREQFAPELVEVDGVVLTRCQAIPFVHFNAVLNLGLEPAATEDALDAVIDAYETAGIKRFTVMHHPFCEPAMLADWLSTRGLTRRQGWDRVYRLGVPASLGAAPRRGNVVFVTTETADTWARFIDQWYGLQTSPWLLELVDRPGWVHATLVENGRIVAARSMFLRPGRSAWFGIEAPVPGLMALSFEEDHCLLHALLAEAVRGGAETFAADVEAATANQSGPAYDRWHALGFSVAYHRSHYVRSPTS
jgi:hypothetical protein